jgi:hypothetical protein
MSCRTLTRDDVSIHIDAVLDDIRVRGNACISGDDRFDRRVEDEILHRLEQHDVWAWACVSVTVSWKNLTATEYLGCCCYQDEEQFKEEGGYFEGMVDTALDALNTRCNELFLLLSRT